MGESQREKAGSEFFQEVGNMNPTVANLFSGYKEPFSVDNILKSIDEYTNQATKNVRKGAVTDINRTRRDTAARFAGSGIKGGALLEDAIKGGENQVRTAGNKTIENIETNSLGLKPGVLERGNQRDFNITQANQETLFRNLQGLFQKLNLKGGALGGLSDTTSFDDILEILNTGGNIAGAIIPG